MTRSLLLSCLPFVLLASVAHATFLAPVSRAFLPGNAVGSWSVDGSESARTCPKMIRHIAYLQTNNPEFFTVRHIDISHEEIDCKSLSELGLISGAALIGRTSYAGVPRPLHRAVEVYLKGDEEYMLAAQRLAAAGVSFYGIVEVGARTCGTEARFEVGTKGFFVANTTTAVKIPPFDKALDTSRKHMALYEGGAGGRRCLYSGKLETGPLPLPLNFVEKEEPTPMPIDELDLSPTPNATISPAPSPKPTAPAIEAGNVFGSSENTTTVSQSRRKCFPANAQVHLRSGRQMRMDELKIGDEVLVGDGEYSRVFMFTHQLATGMHTFVRLISVHGEQLELSHGHYVYISGRLRPAAEATVGDTLVLADGSRTTVSSVQLVQNRGLYNPQTLHGDIVVNGILSSTYTTAVHPTAAHSLLSPVRAICQALAITISA